MAFRDFYYIEFSYVSANGGTVATGVVHGADNPVVVTEIGNRMLQRNVITQYNVRRWAGSEDSFKSDFGPAIKTGEIFYDALLYRESHNA